MKGEVTRARAGCDRGPRRIVRGQRAVLGIEPVDHHAVQSQIDDHREPVRGIDVGGMSMRGRLTARVHARSFVLDKRGRLAQSSLLVDRQHAGTAAAVVCHQHVASGMIERHVTRSGSPGRLRVDQRQGACPRVDLECVHGPAAASPEISHLTHRKQPISLGMDRQKRRIDCLARQHRGTQNTTFQIEHRQVDASAIAPGIGAEIDSHSTGIRLRLLLALRPQRSQGPPAATASTASNESFVLGLRIEHGESPL
jgi:hypothetical protein